MHGRIDMLNFVLCWHFHQPDYRTQEGIYFLPWTYLHAMKDYADMAAHLEAHPNMRAVVNFVPTLLEQLDDYGEQFRTGQIRDPLLARLIQPNPVALTRQEKLGLVESCFKLNLPTMLDPFPAYKRLQKVFHECQEAGDAGLDWLSDQYFVDLVTWYHLAWSGESVRRGHHHVLELMRKGAGFSLADRQYLFDLYGQVVTGLIGRYRAMAERGQIELSSTPHSHPIIPLLLDFDAAREARPELALPQAADYPGGIERSKVHLRAAKAVHKAHFGTEPRGFWPAEGGVSSTALELFATEQVRWVATGEGVLRHSLAKVGRDLHDRSAWLAQPYHLPSDGTACFFRDDHLSDLIGFEYKSWFSSDAVRHFMYQLEDSYRKAASPASVVSVVLDGENAWEYYPYNGYYFLSELYDALESQPDIRVTTFSEYLDLFPTHRAKLPTLVAGSWVYGDFTTWVGDPAKNRAWDLLCEAKQTYDRVMAEGSMDSATALLAESQLKSCESSDWFWWFGDYNPGESVVAFDQLYRAKLKSLYQCLGQPVPTVLDLPLCHGGGFAESGGAMRRGGSA